MKLGLQAPDGLVMRLQGLERGGVLRLGDGEFDGDVGWRRSLERVKTGQQLREGRATGSLRRLFAGVALPGLGRRVQPVFVLAGGRLDFVGSDWSKAGRAVGVGAGEGLDGFARGGDRASGLGVSLPASWAARSARSRLDRTASSTSPPSRSTLTNSVARATNSAIVASYRRSWSW